MKCMHTMGFYLAVKKNKIRKLSGKWTDLVSMMLRKVTHTKKDKTTCSISYADLNLSFVCIMGINMSIKENKKV